ncbi:MAG: DegT/DnrJ/EryC1/StrS family aminotransferase [bacterium]|nr:DegT/DnrJ/EryC1/StrS family aminotransferase [bacterium]
MQKLALFGGTPVLKEKLVFYNSLGKEEERAAVRVMKRRLISDFLGCAGEKFLGGQEIKKFEKAITQDFGVRYAVTFNSATTALQGAVAALGIGPGDEVITSPFTMSATATSIVLNNAIPVFADIDEETYCLSAASIEKCITKKTKAILVVNLFGGPADYAPILKLAKKYNLKIIEDNAQAPGATYRGRRTGTIGDIGILSLNVHKVMQSGEGGVLITNNKRYAYRAQLVRNHGEVVMDHVWESESQTREFIGGSNYRLTELQAAIALEQHKKMHHMNRARNVLADYLTKKLKQFSWLSPIKKLPRSTHVYYLYPVKFFGEKIGFSRATCAKALAAEGFEIEEGYQKPLYLIPMFQNKRMYPHSQFPFISREYPHTVSYKKGICPVVERMYETELFVHALCQTPKTKKTIDLFIRALKKIEANQGVLQQYEKKSK